MSSYSILIVDDEPDNFDVIESLLPSESYTLHYANCGEDAIAALHKFDPDVILLDVMMPSLSGIEVCQRVKLMTEWQAVPIIMVTALSGKEELARCLAAGADDFVNKPVNGLELRARVNSMLRIKKQHDRIQAFSKLQRNNIHSLANSLNEIHLDLAVGFPNEFDLPLHSISDNINYLINNVEHLSVSDTLDILKLSDRSAEQLHKLTKKFWFYLQLLLEHPTAAYNGEISIPQMLVEQNLMTRFEGSARPRHLTCEIEDVRLAVPFDRARWIFNELLDRVLDRFSTDMHLKIHGQIIDNTFHFSLSNCQEKNSNGLNPEMSTFIKFNAPEDDDRDLEIGLKIVKKIVEMYDGIFLISNISAGSTAEDNLEEISVYLTLPLALDNISISAAHSVVGV